MFRTTPSAPPPSAPSTPRTALHTCKDACENAIWLGINRVQGCLRESHVARDKPVRPEPHNPQCQSAARNATAMRERKARPDDACEKKSKRPHYE